MLKITEKKNSFKMTRDERVEYSHVKKTRKVVLFADGLL